MIHFGELVEEVMLLKEINAENAAAYAGVSVLKLKSLLHQANWKTDDVKQFSVALNYDLGKHLSQWDTEVNACAGFAELNFYIQYSPEFDGDKIDQLNIVVRKLCYEFGMFCQ